MEKYGEIRGWKRWKIGDRGNCARGREKARRAKKRIGEDERERERRKGIGKRKTDKREADSKARASWVVEVGGTEQRIESRRRETDIWGGDGWSSLDGNDKKKDGGSRDTFLLYVNMRSKQHAILGSMKNMFEISMILISLSIHSDMPCKFSLTGNIITDGRSEMI